MGQTAEATRLLRDLSQGSRSAADELLPLVYDELRELAACWMARENPGHTLEATALVHEAYLRMIDQANVDWKNRAHFFAVAAKMIRRVLVDHARQRRATKRGGGSRRVELDEGAASLDVGGVDLLALDDALEQLDRLNDRHRRVVELRFFGGLQIQEVAHLLGVSPETVKSGWRTARAWLRTRLAPQT